MSYNQTSNELSIVNKKTTFRNYMKTQSLTSTNKSLLPNICCNSEHK